MKRVTGLGTCTPDENGWANVDMDSYGDAATISLTFQNKPFWKDSDNVEHGATVCTEPDNDGDCFFDDAPNGRYTLPCKQTAGKKTIKVNVTRPSGLTKFGAEWVQPPPTWHGAGYTNIRMR